MTEANPAWKMPEFFQGQNGLRAILDGVGTVVIVTDRRSHVIYMNSACEAMLGVLLDAAAGRSVWDLMSGQPEQIAQARAAFELVWQGPFPYLREERWIAQSGEIRWLLWTMNRLVEEGSGEQYLVATGLDITAQKYSEQELRASEERYASILSAVPDLIFRLDRQGVFLDYSTSDAAKLLMPPDQFLGRPVSEILPLPVAQLTLENLHRVLNPDNVRSRNAYRYEYPLDLPHGTAYFEARMIAVDPDDALVIVRDITSQKSVENELRRQALLFESAFDAVIFTDSEGRIADWNAAAEQMFGYSREEVVGLSPDIIHCPEDRPALQQRILEALKRDGRWMGEIGFVRKDGAQGVLEAVVARLRDQDGGVASVGVNRDITARKRIEDDLRRREAILGAVSFAAENFLRGASWEAEIQTILNRLGQAAIVSRVYVFQNHLSNTGALLASQRFEWAAPGVSAQIENPVYQGLPYEHDLLRGRQALLAANQIVQGAAAQYSGMAQEILEAEETRSVLIVPIFAGQQWWGFIGFDECGYDRLWGAGEVESLRLAAGILGAAIQRSRLEKIHAATLRISEAAHSARNMDEVYRSIHAIVNELMPAQNLYIALYDREADILRFPYFVDEFDTPPAAGKPGKTLTSYLLRTGEPLLATPDIFAQLVASGEVENAGTSSIDWMGVPLKTDGIVFGAMVVQSYSEGIRFGLEDVNMLSYVSTQIAMAIERRWAEEAVQRRMQRLAALRTVDMAISASLDMRVSLAVLLDHLTMQLNVDAADVLLFSPVTQMLEYTAGRGFHSFSAGRAPIPLSDSVIGQVVVERRMVEIHDWTTLPDDFLRRRGLALENFSVYYAVPLVAKSQVKGVLEVFHRSALLVDRDWLEFLETLAGQAAIAVENAILFDDLQRTNTDLALAYDTTLEGWVRALDLRDQETEGHTQRVTVLTIDLARNMGIPESDIVHVRRGALLHDIGKIAIPDSILQKPGPLNDEEKAIMDCHPVYAYELLQPIDYLRYALDIPYCHHERWDGTGYPRQLKGEQIPLTARIFAVVDVWDALSTNRPYRKAWPIERVRDHILGEAGRHFDPYVVTVFLRMIEERHLPS